MNYHQLPCGTVIPPEGIEAWVKMPYQTEWIDGTILAYFDDCIVTKHVNYRQYSLTDPTLPTLPKGRWVTPYELYGKCLHFNSHNGIRMMVIGSDFISVFTRNQSKTIQELVEECKGYSDTPTSEVRSFWVEEI